MNGERWNRLIYLHDVSDTGLHGDLAFPMVSRCELMGALVCGAKRDGETYAPDESYALLTLARSEGTALDTLTLRNGEAVSMQKTLALIVEKLKALTKKSD